MTNPTMPGEPIRVAGATITLESVVIGKLNVDYSYQRPLRTHTWKKYAKEFDLEKFGTPMVSARGDSSLWVMDGQHRIKAAQVALDLDDSQMVPANVYRGLTVEKEADLWVAYNVERTAPHRDDNHRAMVVAGRPLACAVEKTVSRHGFEIGSGNAVGRINAVGIAYELEERGVLDSTLSILGSAWGADQGALRGPLMKAVGLILARYGRSIDRRRLIQRLAVTNPDTIVAKASSARAADPDSFLGSAGNKSGKTVVDFVARVIITTYNYRKSSGRLTAWESRHARAYWDPQRTKTK